jgi:glycosyltransferase involved in cell wall biosynthesis
MSSETITNKKKVAVLCRAWYPNHERIFTELAKYNSDAFEIFYIVTAGVESSKYNKRPWEIPSKCSINRVIIRSVIITIFDKDIILPLGILRTLREINPDLIIVTPWSEISTYLGILYAKIHKINILAWLPGPFDKASTLNEKFRNFFTRTLLSLCVHLSTSVLVYGPSVEDAIKKIIFFNKNLNKNIHFYNVFHSVNESTYEFTTQQIRDEQSALERDKLNIPKNAFVIGYIGQLLQRKGIVQLANTLSHILTSHSSVYFLILGTGPLLSLIEELKKKFKERVIIINQCNLSDLKCIYSSIDLVIIPSLRDDWSTITNECFLSRTPVLGSIYAYSCRDLISDKITGYTFDPLNQSNFINKINEIIANRSDTTTIINCAYEFIKNRWSENHSLAAWTSCIRNFLYYEHKFRKKN